MFPLRVILVSFPVQGQVPCTKPSLSLCGKNLVNISYIFVRNSSVGVSTRLWVGIYFRIAAGVSKILRNAQTAFEMHSASYSMGIGVLSKAERGQGMKLTTESSLVFR